MQLKLLYFISTKCLEQRDLKDIPYNLNLWILANLIGFLNGSIRDSTRFDFYVYCLFVYLFIFQK